MGALSISRKLRHRSEQLFDRRGKTRTDSYAYNTRSELTGASLGVNPYSYDYDNIGNRKTAQEIAQESTYAANTLNQYSAITRNQVPFTPTFDPDGNQTLVQTSTGIWKVTYNADSRPVRFTQQGGTTTIDCGYDYMGRRYEKKITVNGAITLHQHYLYRGYLQIAALDKKRTHLPALWYTHWDPTEPTATRPLSIRKNGTWYTYGCDLTKNVQELFTNSGAIATTYDYTPFGAVTRQGAFDQPFQWSSEIYDVELALTYYNYRHYNPMDGRWINRDPIAEQGGVNLYAFVGNNSVYQVDVLGFIELTAQNVADCLEAKIVVDKPSGLKFGMGKRVVLVPGQRRNLKPYHHTYAIVEWKKDDDSKNKCCNEISYKYNQSELNWVQLTLLKVDPSGSDSNKPDEDLDNHGWTPNNLLRKTMLGKYHELEKQLSPGGDVHDRGYGSVPIPITFNRPPTGYRFIIKVRDIEIYRAEHYFNNEVK